MNIIYASLIILELTSLVLTISSPYDAVYKAGVVEFAYATEGTPKQKLKDNVKRIIEIIESPDTRDLDILVFPEYVINSMDRKTYVPDPKLKISPCETPIYDLSLSQLSCATRSRNLYVVINMVEKENCSNSSINCSENAIRTYNTNIVFDRKGRVISRYRKSHLYGNEWYSTNVMPTPELATFSTDFGVTFGHFICFDMMFYNPAMVLVNDLNISDIIYPTFWFSELPFLTAVQLQEGWAYANNVNLLAADASNPSERNSGSGIYAGQFGRLNAIIVETATTKLLKAEVPKKGFNYEMPPNILSPFLPKIETPRLSKLSLLRDYNVDSFTTKLLGENFSNILETICHFDFCCSFEISREFINNSKSHLAYQYRIAAYSGNGTTIQRRDQSELSICAVIACTNDQLYSCGLIFPENILVGNKYFFKNISVSGSFRKSYRRLIMPSTVDGQLMPLPVSMWEMLNIEDRNSTEVLMTLKYPKSDILTFGIWANYYLDAPSTHNLDVPYLTLQEQSRSSGYRNFMNIKFLILQFFSVLVVNKLKIFER